MFIPFTLAKRWEFEATGYLGIYLFLSRSQNDGNIRSPNRSREAPGLRNGWCSASWTGCTGGALVCSGAACSAGAREVSGVARAVARLASSYSCPESSTPAAADTYSDVSHYSSRKHASPWADLLLLNIRNKATVCVFPPLSQSLVFNISCAAVC